VVATLLAVSLTVSTPSPLPTAHAQIRSYDECCLLSVVWRSVWQCRSVVVSQCRGVGRLVGRLVGGGVVLVVLHCCVAVLLLCCCAAVFVVVVFRLLSSSSFVVVVIIVAVVIVVVHSQHCRPRRQCRHWCRRRRHCVVALRRSSLLRDSKRCAVE